MKIGIVGTRRRDAVEDFSIVSEKFKEIYEEGDTIVSGGCPKGGDRFAEIIANKLKIPIVVYVAHWDKYGKSAGFIRNSLIVDYCDVLIACVAEDRKGGTEDTIRKAEKLKKKVYVV